MTTEFVTLLYLPLIPIRSYRVLPGEEHGRTFIVAGYSNTRYRILEPFNRYHGSQILGVYAITYGTIGSLVLCEALLGTRLRPGPLFGMGGNIGEFSMYAAALWPLLLGWILRRAARKRAGLVAAT